MLSQLINCPVLRNILLVSDTELNPEEGGVTNFSGGILSSSLCIQRTLPELLESDGRGEPPSRVILSKMLGKTPRVRTFLSST